MGLFEDIGDAVNNVVNEGKKAVSGVSNGANRLAGDIGREATTTPLGRAVTGSFIAGAPGAYAGLLTTPGIFDYQGKTEPGADFQPVQSRWNSISNGFTTGATPQSVMQGQQQAAQGANQSLNTLGQYGGQAVGAGDRMSRASKWGNSQNSLNVMQDNNISKLQTQQQGITGIDLPIQQGKEQAAAQAAAIRSRNGGSAWGMIGTIGGGIAGGMFGGPTGAAIGAGVGGGLGQNIGSRQ